MNNVYKPDHEHVMCRLDELCDSIVDDVHGVKKLQAKALSKKFLQYVKYETWSDKKDKLNVFLHECLVLEFFDRRDEIYEDFQTIHDDIDHMRLGE